MWKKLIIKKWDYYNRHQLDNAEYGKLYSKMCFSNEDTTVFTRGEIWSDMVNTRQVTSLAAYLWLWDSVFHAVGYRNIDANIAEQLILSVFDSQYENGMIPTYVRYSELFFNNTASSFWHGGMEGL